MFQESTVVRAYMSLCKVATFELEKYVRKRLIKLQDKPLPAKLTPSTM